MWTSDNEGIYVRYLCTQRYRGFIFILHSCFLLEVNNGKVKYVKGVWLNSSFPIAMPPIKTALSLLVVFTELYEVCTLKNTESAFANFSLLYLNNQEG